jgi:hypothetical protein
MERDIFFKITRDSRLTDADLQQMMGKSSRTAVYRNHNLFENRRLPRPYNEPPAQVDGSYPKL